MPKILSLCSPPHHKGKEERRGKEGVEMRPIAAEGSVSPHAAAALSASTQERRRGRQRAAGMGLSPALKAELSIQANQITHIMVHTQIRWWCFYSSTLTFWIHINFKWSILSCLHGCFFVCCYGDGMQSHQWELDQEDGDWHDTHMGLILNTQGWSDLLTAAGGSLIIPVKGAVRHFGMSSTRTPARTRTGWIS